MKKSNPVLDNIIESQTQFINNWMDSAKKMQSAFADGNSENGGQQLYKEYFEKQMGILNNMQSSASGMFTQQGNNSPEFFKNWFDQQSVYARQMTEFVQNMQKNFGGFDASAQDPMAAFNKGNKAFTDIYNTWLNTLNTSYETLSRNMNGQLGKDVFSNFMQGNQVYARMQEFFQPMANAMQQGHFNPDAFKNYFKPEHYRNLTKQMFGNLYNETSVKEVYDSAIRQIRDFFGSQNNLSEEYYAQWKKISEQLPELFAGSSAENMKEVFTHVRDVFTRTFGPLLKLVASGKEKEQIESLIAMMDQIAEYTVQQTEMHGMLQNTAKNAVEEIADKYAGKFADPKALKDMPEARELFTEWVKVNEKQFTELFASDDFSKIKGETINLAMQLKKQFEHQFETTFGNYPFVFKSEMDEMNKTIHDLKKQVRELQSQLSTGTARKTAGSRSTAKSKK